MRHSRKILVPAIVGGVTFALSACTEQSEPPVVGRAEPISVPLAEPATAPELAQGNPLRSAYFGETHMHTAYSLDAYIGGARLTPADAYRFAKGESVTVDGQPQKRKRPLDFVAVSSYEMRREDQLWGWMAEHEAKGIKALAIPHNSYELGVPMGSDLGAVGVAPTFTVYAIKDPDGANLDRIQIIKGWVDAAGGLHEDVIDVAWSGDRQKGGALLQEHPRA